MPSAFASTPAKAGVQVPPPQKRGVTSANRVRRNWAPAFAGVVTTLLSACAAQPRPAVQAAPAPAISPGIQYLYGSGEAGALQLTALHALIAYATDKAAHRPANSVVLAPGSPLVKGTFVPCAGKPLAAVFDADETVLLNIGFEADETAHPGRPYDESRWARWEQTGAKAVAAVPGAAHAFEDLRKAGVTVIVNTNRSAANAAGTVATLKAAGLGDFRPGETLFLRAPGEAGKDGRRDAIAQRWCVVAMAGDQLGDFSDRFADPMPVAARRQLAIHSSAAGLWGKGWFVLPNPAYGAALKGGGDDIFPADKRWTPAP